MLLVTGVVVLALCLAGYFTQRCERGVEVVEVKKYLEIHKIGLRLT
jgi:hypothetical protein